MPSQLLLDHGPNLELQIYKYKPLEIAVEKGNEQIVRLLLDHCPNLELQMHTDYNEEKQYLNWPFIEVMWISRSCL